VGKREMKEEEKRVVGDIPTRFRAQVPIIMEEEMEKNSLRRRTTIFYNQKPMHVPSSFLIRKYYFNSKLCNYPQPNLQLTKIIEAKGTEHPDNNELNILH
jgi:hypothetical protein